MRSLKKEEHDLIVYLLKDNPDTLNLIDELPNLFVEEMNDGGMGSLKFLFNDNNKRRVGKEIAVITLLDVDGIPLSVEVNLDEDGRLYELDVWKVDFSPLKQFPLYPYIIY
jgi:hypothetical protein